MKIYTKIWFTWPETNTFNSTHSTLNNNNTFSEHKSTRFAMNNRYLEGQVLLGQTYRKISIA